MTISVFDLFKRGVGPSSSHTMGPMTAAARFVEALRSDESLGRVRGVTVTLYASLALTGRGHATDRAVVLGLMGYRPATLDPDEGDAALTRSARDPNWRLGGDGPRIQFLPDRDILWERFTRLPLHPNAVRFSACGQGGDLLTQTYYSTGGGFVATEAELLSNAPGDNGDAPYPFASAAELISLCERDGLTIAQLAMANERALRSEAEILEGLDQIYADMAASIDRGLRQDGILPGGLAVRRRALQIHQTLLTRIDRGEHDALEAIDWVNLWAMAVNEENAAGGRVVTAPTNGAAGIVPAVLRYHDSYQGGDKHSRRQFLLTAGIIGALYKQNASISGAEVGCQGEVGVACSMAAAGLAAVSGATNAQIENAAEIGMEHNLGLTCDPIAGLVQIPCIERNAVGAMKAIDAARLALLGDGAHHVTLDQVIVTMKRTGEDMNEIYKETSLGGLAVNAVAC
uniref:L-serine dehydratase n=1 Tax=Caulobacter sp. (strain K31) TaxID=366602 RepID=B0T6N5_CAUSK